MGRLQRTKHDGRFLLCPRTDPSLRLDLKHRIVRRQNKISRRLLQASDALLNTTIDITNNSTKKTRSESLIFDEPVYIYFTNLNAHIDQLIDSLEVQRESVAMLVSLWLALKNNETQKILKILMLVTVLFMPCVLLVGLFSTNYHVQAPIRYKYGYYIVLVVLGAIIFGMITLYKVKRWI
jgi:magnesium transporter